MISGDTHGLSLYGLIMSEDEENSLSPPPHNLHELKYNHNPESTHHHSDSLLYSLSILKNKVHEVESLVSLFLSSPIQTQSHHETETEAEAIAIAIANMGTLIQEIIVTASTMMFTSQQMALTNTTTAVAAADHHHRVNINKINIPHQGCGVGGGGFYAGDDVDTLNNNNLWYVHESFTNSNNNNNQVGAVGVVELLEVRESQVSQVVVPSTKSTNNNSSNNNNNNCDMIIEFAAADLLAKYTHYCRVCGKGFKRDANLRMHMRAHGDQYKSSAALSNPAKIINNNRIKNGGDDDEGAMITRTTATNGGRKYSCPHEGCRWNQRHAKFQPLKSMICVKNHYKRSHCPKMYVCKRCNRKHFSVLSDLRTHEKHCGDVKWQCSCGTTFSRKDKLMGHVALFVGHAPAVIVAVDVNASNNNNNNRPQLQPPLSSSGKVEDQSGGVMQLDEM